LLVLQFGHEDWVFDLKWLDDQIVVSGKFSLLLRVKIRYCRHVLSLCGVEIIYELKWSE